MGYVVFILWFIFILVFVSKAKKDNQAQNKSTNYSSTNTHQTNYQSIRRVGSIGEDVRNTLQDDEPAIVGSRQLPKNLKESEDMIISRVLGSSTKLNGGQKFYGSQSDRALRGRLSKESRDDEKKWFK